MLNLNHWERTKGKVGNVGIKGAEGQKERAVVTGRDQHKVGLVVAEVPGYIQV